MWLLSIAVLILLLHTLSALSVIHISDLPPGWLGKTHAMHVGAAEAGGTYLLFTDGDVTMAPTTISRSDHRMQTKQLDHLTLLFKNSTVNWLLNSLILDAVLGFVQLLRVWRAKDTSSRHFVGVGAFNMVCQKMYTDIGGHESFKTHPIDDIMHRAAWRIWRDGGIYWRSTFYSLSYLKNNESTLFLRR